MAPNGAREARTLPQSRVCGFVGQLDCPFVILSEAKDLPQRESHSFACVCRGFDCEVPLPRACGIGMTSVGLVRAIYQAAAVCFGSSIVPLNFGGSSSMPKLSE